jgi:hypothetical protein
LLLLSCNSFDVNSRYYNFIIFKTVLVLHGLWRAWSGLRVFPLSCPLHYPAVSCKPAATLGPHLGASVGPMLSLIVLIGSANENSFCYIVDPPIFVLALLCIHRTIEISQIILHGIVLYEFSEINYLCLCLCLCLCPSVTTFS